jgi:hypothetical protein
MDVLEVTHQRRVPDLIVDAFMLLMVVVVIVQMVFVVVIVVMVLVRVCGIRLWITLRFVGGFVMTFGPWEEVGVEPIDPVAHRTGLNLQ